MPYRADTYNDATPLMREIRADGIGLRSRRAEPTIRILRYGGGKSLRRDLPENLP